MRLRVRPYLAQIAGVIKWRLTSELPKLRQRAADLISRIAVVMKTCREEKLMGQVMLFYFFLYYPMFIQGLGILQKFRRRIPRSTRIYSRSTQSYRKFDRSD